MSSCGSDCGDCLLGDVDDFGDFDACCANCDCGDCDCGGCEGCGDCGGGCGGGECGGDFSCLECLSCLGWDPHSRPGNEHHHTNCCCLFCLRLPDDTFGNEVGGARRVQNPHPARPRPSEGAVVTVQPFSTSTLPPRQAECTANGHIEMVPVEVMIQEKRREGEGEGKGEELPSYREHMERVRASEAQNDTELESERSLQERQADTREQDTMIPSQGEEGGQETTGVSEDGGGEDTSAMQEDTTEPGGEGGEGAVQEDTNQ